VMLSQALEDRSGNALLTMDVARGVFQRATARPCDPRTVRSNVNFWGPPRGDGPPPLSGGFGLD